MHKRWIPYPVVRYPAITHPAYDSIPLPYLSRFKFEKPSRPVRDAGRDVPFVTNLAGTGCGMVTLI